MIRIALPLTLAAALGACAARSDVAARPAPRSAAAALAQAKTEPVGMSSARPAGAASGTLGLAQLKNAAGQAVGTARVTRAGNDLRVAVTAEGLPPGVHGIHLHAVGQCAAPDFASAGPHWNPMAKQHGRDNPAGPHDGDLPNITIGADGRGTLEATVSGGAHTGAGALLDADGAALVIHAAADDLRTDPAGNSGARIACGVVQAGL
ncbi:MAG: superoxide dismutase family protein [Sphingomicrobium sp.]